MTQAGTTIETTVASGIPEPPREVRWSACLRRRWILALIGGALTTIGLILGTMTLIEEGGASRDDDLLDAGAWTTIGQITALNEDGSVWRVEYEFDVKGAKIFGTSFVASPPSSMRVDGTCTVEYVGGRPDINRIQGTSSRLFRPTFELVTTVLLVAGIISLFIWFRGALRLRIALREGRLTTAQIIQATRLRHVNPNPVSVQFRFVDNLGQERIGGHWVAARSTIGRHLLEDSPREHPVIHDEGDPELNRLACAEDFLTARPSHATEPLA